MTTLVVKSSCKRVKRAFLLNCLLGSPFFDLLTLFVTILIIELHVSGAQMTVALALRPACSLLSPYWSSIIHRRQDLVKTNLVLANILCYFPFLFFPFCQSTWLLIASVGIYWVIAKGMKPAWMELIKVNIPEGRREKVCALGLKMKYYCNIIFSILIGGLLDAKLIHWQWMFFFAALVGIGSTFFIMQIDRLSCVRESILTFSLRRVMIRPWRDVFRLLRTDRPFLRFQIIFFLGGTGLVLFHPAVKQLLAFDLKLSYTVINSASVMVKGIGFIIASPIWVKYFRQFSILKLSLLMMALALFFPYFLLFGGVSLFFIYLAYFFYGMMQAGSELIWNLSGLSYAKQRSSSVYSSTNLLMVGIRGIIFPAVGTYLMGATDVRFTLMCGSGIILIGIAFTMVFIRVERRGELELEGTLSSHL